MRKIAETSGQFSLPSNAAPLLDLYDRLFAVSEGAVTPLIGQSLERLGYDASYSLTRSGPDLPAADWSTEVSHRDGVLVTRSPVLIDVGAAGKGYLVDLVAEVLIERGITEFVIDASGDLLVSQPLPSQIALEHPFDPTLAIGVAHVENQAICASGSNRRVWGEGLHHILDGRTGHPTRDIIATWAIADSALLADGLATALFFVPPADLARTFDFSCVRMFASGWADHSLNFNGELFS